MKNTEIVASFIHSCFDLNSTKASETIERSLQWAPEFANRLIRIGANTPGHTPLFYRQLYHYWSTLDKPFLKPSRDITSIKILSDLTVGPLSDLVSIFTAARGVKATLSVSEFDNIEFNIFDKSSDLMSNNYEFVVVILSEHWIKKHLGKETLFDLSNVQDLEKERAVSEERHASK